jgi:hypothetical protein
MTDLGSLHHFLGVTATRTSSTLFLSQRQYIIDLLNRAGMIDCQPYRTPTDVAIKLSVDGDPVPDPTLYRSLTGALQYNMLLSPDPTSLILFSKHVSICLILVYLISLMSKRFFAT